MNNLKITNSDETSRYLIIGGDGTIGSHLCRLLNKLKKPFLYTSRRPTNKKNANNILYLDLSKDISNWQPPENIKTAFFCAGITSMEFCENNIDVSRTINVINTIKIIQKLSNKNIPVIFLSSNQVFNGVYPYPDENTLTSPRTVYGCQKKEVENFIKKSGKNNFIVRITKVIHNNYGLFNKWISSLRKGIPISAFSDYLFSPVPISIVGNILINIANSNKNRVWHISGNKDISYYDAATLIAKSIGADVSLIQSNKARDILKNAYLPPSTVLECNRLKSNFGITPPDVKITIKSYYNRHEADPDLPGFTSQQKMK